MLPPYKLHNYLMFGLEMSRTEPQQCTTPQKGRRVNHRLFAVLVPAGVRRKKAMLWK